MPSPERLDSVSEPDSFAAFDPESSKVMVSVDAAPVPPPRMLTAPWMPLRTPPERVGARLPTFQVLWVAWVVIVVEVPEALDRTLKTSASLPRAMLSGGESLVSDAR